MGLTYADLKLTNLFTNQSVTMHTLDDSGATFMCVTEEIAHQLGFDPSEVSTQFVHTADGRQLKVPKIAPIEIAYENRTYVTEALVMGDEALMGVLPLDVAADNSGTVWPINLELFVRTGSRNHFIQ